jgi:hypothetical protein
MRKVTIKGKEGNWETPLDKEEEEEFRQLLRDLKELREIRFPRCVQPLEGQFRRSLLLVFGDGSREACCTLVYLRWERDDGSAQCVLVTGKTQVAPKVKRTIPRMELVAAVNSVRLEESQGGTEVPSGRDEVLQRLVGCAGHAEDRVRKVPRVRGSESERGEGEQQCGERMEVA